MFKKTKNRVIAAVLSIVILFLFFSMCSCFDSVLETDDISNYNSECYPLLETIFLEELPSNAEVIEFTYYKYYYEMKDVYLELKFSTLEEMNEYISTLRSNGNGKITRENKYHNDWFLEIENPYDSSYTDLICLSHTIGNVDGEYVGYYTELEEYYDYEAVFGVISYSTEDLIVIQSSFGGFPGRSKIHFPKYLQRFGMTSDMEIDRRIYLEEI